MDKRLSLAAKYMQSQLPNEAWAIVRELIAQPEPSIEALCLALDLRVGAQAFEEVLVLCDRAVARAASTRNDAIVRAEIALARAQAHFGLDDLARADVALAATLRERPDHPQAYFHLGALRHRQGRLAEAEAAYRTAITRQSPFPAAWNNLGNVLDALGRVFEAREAFSKALQQDPGFAPAHTNLGANLASQGAYAAAAAAHRKALQHDPSNTPARLNLGVALLEQGLLGEAAALFAQIHAQHPTRQDAADNLLYAKIFEEEDPAAIHAAHAAWGAKFPLPPAPPIADADPNRRLRVGYVSPDFRQHSVSYFLSPLLGAHDPAAVEIFCYAEVAQGDAVTERLKSKAAHWRVTYGRDDADVHALISADRIDILVDLAGHTKGNRLTVFARRPAPVQVTALGYPATTGLKAIDYYLCDSVTDPPGAEAFATEALFRLPTGMHCYAAPENAPAPSALPAARNGHVTFGSFNKLTKISEATVKLWAAALQATPHARLLIKARALADEETRARALAMFAAQDIAAERLELMGWHAGDRDHLAVYNRVDIALDTFPYNGTTTTCEALWMGVPVLALAGRTHAGRVGASLLTQVNMADWIAATPTDFAARAARFSAGLPGLAKIRAGLRDAVARSVLCDAKAHARAVEEAYRAMWRKVCGN